MNCTNCEAPTRRLWVLFGSHRQPILAGIHDGNWISIRRCDECGALWCYSPYEPYAFFPYAAIWPFDVARWHHTHAFDDGRTLRGWHAFMIGQLYHSLPPPEIEMVEYHRTRSYGHNPIDRPQTFHAADLPGDFPSK